MEEGDPWGGGQGGGSGEPDLEADWGAVGTQAGQVGAGKSGRALPATSCLQSGTPTLPQRAADHRRHTILFHFKKCPH